MKNPFRCEVVAATEMPQRLIYLALHNDYSEDFHPDTTLPEDRCGQIAAKRLLDGKRGHWGPLEHPTLSLLLQVDHNTMVQLRTHRVGLCLGGDTMVSFGHPSLSTGEVYYTEPISQLADLWHKGRKHQPTEADAAYMRRQISSRSIMTVNEETGLVQHSRIKNIYQNGLRDVWLIRLDDGSSLEATLDHKVLTPCGWKAFRELLPGDEVLTAKAVPGTPPQECGIATGEEEWRPVPRYPLYEVSSHGRLRSWAPRRHRGVLVHPGSPRMKKPSTASSGGYLYASMTEKPCGKSVRRNIHELVLEAFSGKRPEGMIARHVNGVATDNRLENLEWATEAQNAKDRARDRVTRHKKAVPATISLMLYVGKRMTYDIEVEGPYHNFLANGIVVHNSFDVQSQRYSGTRIERVARGEVPVEEVFYIRPPGVYRDRQGDSYEWTASQVERMRQLHHNAAQDYADLRAEGVAEEHARYVLPTSYFQNVLLTGNARSWLHLLDVRLKADAQNEIRWAMELAEACYRDWVPEIHAAWAAERRGKAILAP